MTESQIVECCICMDDIIGNLNKTITECGHIFHCSCLMKNTTFNGYGCPYCRSAMAEEVNSDIDIDNESEYNSENEYDDEEENADDNILTTFRMFHQIISGEEVEPEPEDNVDEDDEDDELKPTARYVAHHLERIGGASYEDLVKCLLLDHDEYADDDMCEKESDRIFGLLRIIISNYDDYDINHEPINNYEPNRNNNDDDDDDDEPINNYESIIIDEQMSPNVTTRIRYAIN